MSARYALAALSLICLSAMSALAEPVERIVIEDGRAEPAKYYDEKPAFLEQSNAMASEGKTSLHFRSEEKPGRVLLTRYTWPDAVDFTSIAADGVISFDLWVDDAAKIGSPAEVQGDRFEFTVGSRVNDNMASWYVPSSLLKSKQWNKVRLSLRGGRPQLNDSSINDVPVTKGKDPVVVAGKEIVWPQINHNRWGIPTYGAVEMYIDNCVAERRKP